MATILQFPMMLRLEDDKFWKPKGPAQILFFTGVRYERREPKDLRKGETEPILPVAL